MQGHLFVLGVYVGWGGVRIWALSVFEKTCNHVIGFLSVTFISTVLDVMPYEASTLPKILILPFCLLITFYE